MDWPAEWCRGVGPGDVQGLLASFGWPLVAGAAALVTMLAALACRVRRSRRLWCPDAACPVEAEFENAGLPGFRQAVAVASCTAFDPPPPFRCRRRCLDPSGRRRWPREPAMATDAAGRR